MRRNGEAQCTHIVDLLALEASGVVDPPVAHQPHVRVDSHTQAELAIAAVVEVLEARAGGRQLVAPAVDGALGQGLLIHCELIYKHPLVPVARQVAAVLMAERKPLLLGCRCKLRLGGCVVGWVNFSQQRRAKGFHLLTGSSGIHWLYSFCAAM